MAKLMLVEDDNNLREIYEARLQAEGYTIVAARDGEEALVVAKAEHPDLIISDVMMPKISGFEMLDILRNTDGLKDVKIIMLTALGQTDDQQRANQLGADRYLVKSQVTLEDIVKVTHDLLSDQALPAAVTTNEAPAPTFVQTAPTGPAPATPITPVATTETASSPPPMPEPSIQTPPEPSPAASAVSAQPVAIPSLPVSPMPPTPTTDQIINTTPPPATDNVLADSALNIPVSPEPSPPSAPTPQPSMQTTFVDNSSPEVKQPATDVSVAASLPQSGSQEKAGVESKIEDFVAGATETATPPQDVPSQSINAVPQDIQNPEPPSDNNISLAVPVSPPSNVAADDKLIDNAVKDLVDNTSGQDKPVDTDKPIVITPTSSGDDNHSNETKPLAPQPSKPDSTSYVPVIAHKKVITPIDSGPKKDIELLLAKEEARESSSNTQQAVISPDSPPTQSSAAATNPDSIAL